MSEFLPEAIVEKLFKRIRGEFKLGMREYLAALDAIQGGFGSQDLETLRSTLELLWCHTLAQQQQFQDHWQEAIKPSSQVIIKEAIEPAPPIDPDENLPQVPIKKQQPPQPVVETPTDADLEFNLQPLPVRTPSLPDIDDNGADLEAHGPITRRSMGYLWRYLRRPSADGPRDVLDLQATVEQAAQKGIFLGPVYKRREVNHAHLMLFIDQAGSMVPLHRFTRDLVETAQEDSTLEQLGIYYFYNIPDTHIYEDPALATKPIELEKVIQHCDRDTSVLIVSDAGAARGQRRMDRFRDTTRFIARLKRQTNLIGWLNPIPAKRWPNTTADMVARLVPMAQMDNDGFRNVIDIARGQPWHRAGRY